MNLEIRDDYLVALCGGQWGSQSVTNLGTIVLDYLYGDKDRIAEREATLGAFLVRHLAEQCKMGMYNGGRHHGR